jgi:hypothetical protein
VEFKMDALKPVTSEQVRTALAELLERQGAYGVADDVVVRELVTRTGRKMYTIIVTNGAEQVVKGLLSGFTGPYGYCGAGTWVLREAAVSALFKRAAAPDSER